MVTRGGHMGGARQVRQPYAPFTALPPPQPPPPPTPPTASPLPHLEPQRLRPSLLPLQRLRLIRAALEKRRLRAKRRQLTPLRVELLAGRDADLALRRELQLCQLLLERLQLAPRVLGPRPHLRLGGSGRLLSA